MLAMGAIKTRTLANNGFGNRLATFMAGFAIAPVHEVLLLKIATFAIAVDKVFECASCGCYLRNEDAFHVDCYDYCEQCAEELLEDKRQEIKDLEDDLKNAREAFERRKAERE